MKYRVERYAGTNVIILKIVAGPIMNQRYLSEYKLSQKSPKYKGNDWIFNHKESTPVTFIINILLTFPSLTNSGLEKFKNTKDEMPQNENEDKDYLYLSTFPVQFLSEEHMAAELLKSFEKPLSHLVYFVGILQEVLKKSSSRWLWLSTTKFETVCGLISPAFETQTPLIL